MNTIEYLRKNFKHMTEEEILRTAKNSDDPMLRGFVEIVELHELSEDERSQWVEEVDSLESDVDSLEYDLDQLRKEYDEKELELKDALSRIEELEGELDDLYRHQAGPDV